MSYSVCIILRGGGGPIPYQPSRNTPSYSMRQRHIIRRARGNNAVQIERGLSSPQSVILGTDTFILRRAGGRVKITGDVSACASVRGCSWEGWREGGRVVDLM